jgi:hypothetical protein
MGDSMLLLEEIVLQEKNRIENMIKLYESELSSLAHGTLVKKKINGKDYVYIQYRDGKKIISKYIGKSEEKIAEIKEQLVRRHQIEIILKQLKAEHTLAKKYMEVSG